MRIALVSQEYPPDTAHGGIASQTHRKAHGLARAGPLGSTSSRAAPTAHHRRGRGRRSRGHPTRPRARRRDCRTPTSPTGSRTAHRSLPSSPAAHDDDSVRHHRVPGVRRRGLRAPAESHRVERRAGRGAAARPARHARLRDRVARHRLGALPRRHAHGGDVRAAWPTACTRRAPPAPTGALERTAGPIEDIAIIHSGVDVDAFPARTRDRRTTARRSSSSAGSPAAKGSTCSWMPAIALAAERPDLRVRLIGRDDDGPGCRAAVASRGCRCIPTCSSFADSSAATTSHARLCQGHVFAAPSIYEGGPGFVYLEAMACGPPGGRL